MTNVHLIDDDTTLHGLLHEYFATTGIHITASETPSQGLAWLSEHPVDLVILDLMLPEMDGFEVCKKIQSRWPQLPVIMLTARGDDLNRILGLELGADDYMAKPFNPRELLARIKTVLRRLEKKQSVPASDSTKGQMDAPTWDLHLDLDARSVSRHGQSLDFTATEFDLLRVLMENVGIVQSREQLMNKVKGFDWDSVDRSIDIYVSKIRQKIHDNAKKPQIIKTVWGIGYIFPEL